MNARLTIPFCQLRADSANDTHILTIERAAQFAYDKELVRFAEETHGAGNVARERDRWESALLDIQADTLEQFNQRAIEVAASLMVAPKLWRTFLTDIHTRTFAIGYFVWAPEAGPDELAWKVCGNLGLAWSSMGPFLGAKPHKLALHRGIAAQTWIAIARRFGVEVVLCDGDLERANAFWWERQFEASRETRNWMSIDRLNRLALEAAALHCLTRP